MKLAEMGAEPILDPFDPLQTLAERSIRILVVDDCEDDAALLYAELTARGARIDYRRVDTAQTLEEALLAEAWDLIICDHNMPCLDSQGALEVFRRSGKDIPFIIYSGAISDATALSAMGRGVCDYIHKGNFAHLVPVIERELRGAAARHAARSAARRIRELACYDPLLNLPNHHMFCRCVDEWLLRDGGDRPAALFYIDLDRFMRINASFGYDAGNGILRQVGRRLEQSIDPGAILSRLNADEFAILCPQFSQRDSASAFGQRLLNVFNQPFTKDSIELFLTPSIGITLLPIDGRNVHDLLMNAESAMALAKRNGGNQCCFYSQGMNSHSAERVVLETDLRHAVARTEFFLQFQPMVSTLRGHVVGVEALLRWRHPQFGLVPPDRFIPLADESGLIVEIGAWVLDQACNQGRIWHELGHHGLCVSVNVSAVQFGQPRFLEVVAGTLSRSGFPPDCLELEITESALMRDAEGTIGMLRALKGMGVRISVDDFGTGYSSLSYLRRFPIDILKVDKSFVGDLGAGGEDDAIVRAVTALAKSLRLTTVAEGVETEAQLRFLQAEGVDQCQGYYFSRPMDAEAIASRLAKVSLPSANAPTAE